MASDHRRTWTDPRQDLQGATVVELHGEIDIATAQGAPFTWTPRLPATPAVDQPPPDPRICMPTTAPVLRPAAARAV